jgi:carbon-monoxide dehydrogenase medium subunit
MASTAPPATPSATQSGPQAHPAPSAALWREYHTPASVAAALDLLHRYGPAGRIVAGGTDLILDMQQGGHRTQDDPVQALVDITHIPGLADIREEPGWIVLGAAVTHAQIEQSARVRHHGTALAESCSVVGGPQVRNVATLGGNVAHALPAADGAIGLLALDAEVQVATWTPQGVEYAWQPLLSVYAGPGRNALTPGQMLAAFRFPALPARTGSAFDRIMRPQGVALPVLGVAARLTLDPDRTRVEQAIVAVGPAGPVPFRAAQAEATLQAASRFDADTVEAAVAAAHAEARLRSSKHRASRAYRAEVLGVLLRRVLAAAFARA